MKCAVVKDDSKHHMSNRITSSKHNYTTLNIYRLFHWDQWTSTDAVAFIITMQPFKAHEFSQVVKDGWNITCVAFLSTNNWKLITVEMGVIIQLSITRWKMHEIYKQHMVYYFIQLKLILHEYSWRNNLFITCRIKLHPHSHGSYSNINDITFLQHYHSKKQCL